MFISAGSTVTMLFTVTSAAGYSRTSPPPAAPRARSSSIALDDIDNDGDLDLYIVNYGANSVLKDCGKLDIVRDNGKLAVRGPYANRIKFIGN